MTVQETRETHVLLAGTSMAAPQVTGTVGLIREIAPESTAKQVEKAIEQGAEPFPARVMPNSVPDD